jgi:hypothetical protein
LALESMEFALKIANREALYNRMPILKRGGFINTLPFNKISSNV